VAAAETAGYGVFWFLGSTAIGLLYERSLGATIAFCVAMELAAVPVFAVGSASIRFLAGIARGPDGRHGIGPKQNVTELTKNATFPRKVP